MKSLAVILLLLSSVAYGDIISPTRRVDWTGNAGIPNGIPSQRTTYTTLSSGATAAQINAALAACPPGQEVKLSAGTYAIGSSQIVSNRGVTLRGAGPYSTLITGVPRTSGSARGIVNIESPSSTQTRVFKNISSGSTKGSSNIVLSASEPNIQGGYCIYITQTDDNNIVDAMHSPGANSGNYGDLTGSPSGTHHSSQLVLVTGVTNNSTRFTFTPPLYFDFTNVTGQVWYWQSSQVVKTNNMVSWAGIEDLAIQNTQASGSTPQTSIGIALASYCWVKNVRTIDAYASHMEIDRAYRCEIRGNICTNNLAGTSGAGYGILMYYSSSGNLIEDNIVVRNRDFIKVQGGSAGNVISYNYHTNALPYTPSTFTTHSGGTHNAHPIMNLWEGNVTYTPTFDNYWGSASHQTLFRNWYRGPMPYAADYPTPLIIDDNQWYFNVVGNVLGSPEMYRYPSRATRRLSPANVSSSQYNTVLFGYWYLDGGLSGSTDATAQWTNTVYAGNYDFVVTNQTWSNGVSSQTISNSYYYNAAPYYFGTSFTWPPFNPETSALRYGETNIPAGWRYRYGTNRPYGQLAVSATSLEKVVYGVGPSNYIGTVWMTNIGNAAFELTSPTNVSFFVINGTPITLQPNQAAPVSIAALVPGQFLNQAVGVVLIRDIPFSGGGGRTLTCRAVGAAVPSGAPNVLLTSDAALGNDFAVSAGSLSASENTVPFFPGQSGEAYFGFTLTNLSVVNLFASVQATNTVNSFAVEVDGEPVYPNSVWDVPATGAGFVTNYMMFRGLGTASLPTGKQWLLGSGTHYVKIYSQTARTKIASVIVNARPIIQQIQSAGVGNSGITSQ